MDCERARRLVHAFLDDELSPVESYEVAEHLERCSPCAAERVSAQRLRDLLHHCLRKELAPADLRRRISRVGARRRRALSPSRLLLAAGLTLLVLPVVADSGRVPFSKAGLLSDTPIVRRMHGHFFCLRCALDRLHPAAAPARASTKPPPHVPAFQSDDGQVWILLNRDQLPTDAASKEAEVFVSGRYFVASHLVEAQRVEP
jgi:anti-sigma factor (TIGR02949 family)